MRENGFFPQTERGKKDKPVEVKEKKVKSETLPQKEAREIIDELESLFLDYKNEKEKLYELERDYDCDDEEEYDEEYRKQLEIDFKKQAMFVGEKMAQIKKSFQRLLLNSPNPQDKFRLAHLVGEQENNLDINDKGVLLRLYSLIVSDGKVGLTGNIFLEEDRLRFDCANKSVEDIWKLHLIKKRIEAISNTWDLPSQWRELDYEPFDPYLELRKIKAFTKKEKGNKLLPEKRAVQRQRLKEYKENLDKQKRGIAEILFSLEKSVRMDPSTSQYELVGRIYAKSASLRLTPHQISLMERGIEQYIEKHKAVRYYRKKYPDDRELFKLCMGVYPQGKVLIKEGPITLYFRCYDLADYARFWAGPFFYGSQNISDEEKKRANRSGGVAIVDCRVANLRGCITAENSSLYEDNESASEETYCHEEQHAFHKIFGNVSERYVSIDNISDIEAEQDFIDILRTEREQKMEVRAKDEILAYFKDGSNLSWVKHSLFKKEKENGLYDYYQYWLDSGRNSQFKTFFQKKGLAEEKINKLFESVFIKEYHKIIEEALIAIVILQKLFVDKENIAHLLINKPLPQWLRVARRFQEMEESEKERRSQELDKYWQHQKNSWADQEADFFRKQAKKLRPLRKNKFPLKAPDKKGELS